MPVPIIGGLAAWKGIAVFGAVWATIAAGLGKLAHVLSYIALHAQTKAVLVIAFYLVLFFTRAAVTRRAVAQALQYGESIAVDFIGPLSGVQAAVDGLGGWGWHALNFNVGFIVGAALLDIAGLVLAIHAVNFVYRILRP